MSLVALKLFQLPSTEELPFPSTLLLLQCEHNQNCLWIKTGQVLSYQIFQNRLLCSHGQALLVSTKEFTFSNVFQHQFLTNVTTPWLVPVNLSLVTQDFSYHNFTLPSSIVCLTLLQLALTGEPTFSGAQSSLTWAPPGSLDSSLRSQFCAQLRC